MLTYFEISRQGYYKNCKALEKEALVNEIVIAGVALITEVKWQE
jgi:hypothetical protein